MKKSMIKAEFSSSVETVWDIVTDNENCDWRTDLMKIDVRSGGRCFTECTNSGFETEFTVTAKELYQRYEFDMKNKNMKGHWSGIFSETDSGGTQIVFTEEVTLSNPIMGLFAGVYLAKQQLSYIRDLKKALGE